MRPLLEHKAPGHDGMRCALFLFSEAVLKTSSGYRFGERWVRPLCHLMVRQQTWQKSSNPLVAAGLQMWDSRLRFPKPGLSQASSARQSACSPPTQPRRPIGFILREHGPSDACQLIRPRDTGNLVVGGRCDLCQPGTQAGRLFLSKLQDCACALYEQPSQVAVPALADA